MIRDRFRDRKMVFYGRVSTEHEAQLSALENQMQWYDDQLKYHPNWTLCGRYIDQGITGTQAKKRPAFLKMMEDARAGKFDLIVTREVCRFARNTVDTLVATRELKNINVEVYFVEDNIWTLDGDGELRLTIMATLAQDESRKISERVKAGQQVSRMNKMLYGNGNILGYKRVGDTYVIEPEQAETVRMIYSWYLQGDGMRTIMGKLIENKRKCASGIVRWDTTKVSRVLHNATYMGYIGYNKSYRNNFLDQKIIHNKEEDYVLVKGDFEPIIPEDVWYACRDLRMDRSTTVPALVKSKQMRIGVMPSTDVWTNKLRCACGSKFKRYKWRQDKDGQRHFGYSCYSRFNNGSAEKRQELGLDTEGYCDMPSVNETKLDVMAAVLFDNIIENKEDVIEEAVKTLNETLKEIRTESKRDFSGYQMRIEKAEKKLDTLLAMRADGEISKEEYIRVKARCDQEIKELKDAMLASAQDHPKEESIDMDYVRDLLGRITVNENGKADKDVLTEFIDTVTVEKDNIFLWGLWLRNKPTYFRMTTEGRGKKMAAHCEEGETYPKSNAPPPKWGKNGRLLSAGCSRDTRTCDINGEGFLFYPGKPYGLDEPVGTLRLQSARDGIEDKELLLALREGYAAMGEAAGYDISAEAILDSLYEQLFDEMRILTNSERFFRIRRQMLDLAELFAGEEKFAVADVMRSGNDVEFEIALSAESNLKRGGETLSPEATYGEGENRIRIYRVRGSKLESDSADLVVSSAKGEKNVSLPLGGVSTETYASDWAENATVLYGDISVQGDGADSLAYVAFDAADAGTTQRLVISGDFLESIGEDTDWVSFVLKKGEEDETLQYSICFEFERSAYYYEIASGTIRSAAAETITVRNIYGLPWGSGKVKNIHVYFGAQGDGARTAALGTVTVAALG